MIESILILFVLLLILWFYKEKRDAKKEYNPFREHKKWTKEEQAVYGNYRSKIKKGEY